MSAAGFKLQVPHREGCWTEGDDTRFIMDVGHDWRLKRNGHKGGSTLWFQYRCNDPNCEAVALVRYDVLARFITAGIESSPCDEGKPAEGKAA